jgi:hypothetical protein
MLICSAFHRNVLLIWTSLLSVNKQECVIRELYDILEKLRYPEIAQIAVEQFEGTILAGAKRIDLLHWILQNSPGFNNLFLNKLKDNALQGI